MGGFLAGEDKVQGSDFALKLAQRTFGNGASRHD